MEGELPFQTQLCYAITTSRRDYLAKHADKTGVFINAGVATFRTATTREGTDAE